MPPETEAGNERKAEPTAENHHVGTVPPNSTIIPGQATGLAPRPSKKIAIIGTCPSRTQAPFDDKSWEIWTIGPGGKNVHRWERLFEVHGVSSWPAGVRVYLEELKSVEPPRIIYTEAPMPDWPANIVLPKQALFEKYGRMWFQSQISYAIAVALEEGPSTIGVWGIDLEAGEEYRSQYTGAKYFLDIAKLAGIDIIMPNGCGLLRDPSPYPDAWETHLAMTLKSKIEMLTGLMNTKGAQLEALKLEAANMGGQISVLQWLNDLYVISGVNPADPNEKPKEQETLSEKVERIDFMLRGLVDSDNNPLKPGPLPDAVEAVEQLPEQFKREEPPQE